MDFNKDTRIQAIDYIIRNSSDTYSNDLDFLTKDISIIDCNRIIVKSKEDLLHLKTEVITTNISKELYEKLVIAINKSRVISTRYKKHIDLSKLK